MIEYRVKKVFYEGRGLKFVICYLYYCKELNNKNLVLKLCNFVF